LPNIGDQPCSIRSRACSVGSGLRYAASNYGWWLLAPISEDRASYSPAIFFGSIALFMPLVYWCAASSTAACKRVPPWDCGFPLQTAACRTRPKASASRSAASFRPSSAARASIRRPSTPAALSQHRRRPDLVLALPADHAARRTRHAPRRLPAAGRIAIYLLYSFATLLTLLVLTRG
jgi:hydrogenase-4 component B